MDAAYFPSLFSFAIFLLITYVIVRHYRERTYPVWERYSTFAPRFWTGTVDSCVLWPLSFVITFLLSFSLPRSVVLVLVIIDSTAWLLYTVLMHGRYGQTVGKIATKVKVVDFRTEGKISYLQAFLRESIPAALSLGLTGYELFIVFSRNADAKSIASGAAFPDEPSWLALSLPFIWFLAEVLTMLTNEKRRALHDYIAGTVVVRTNIVDTTAVGRAPAAAPLK